MKTPPSILSFLRRLTPSMLLPGTLPAAPRTVRSLADGGAESLRKLISASGPGDTIDFAVSGTITLTSGELVVGRDLVIQGPSAASWTVSGNNARRLFRIVPGVTVTISALW